MSTYETLKGLKVKYLNADTSGDRLQEGELFYNSSDFNLKSHIAVGLWSAGGNMITARKQSAANGINTAALVYGGDVAPGTVATTEEYNGSGWSSAEDLAGTKEQHAGTGTQTAALAFGGSGNSVNSEEYDGTNWAEGNNLNTGRFRLGAFGTQTAAVGFAGYTTPPATGVQNTEEYNGTSW